MRVQRTRTQPLRAPLTTMLGHPKSTQCNFNSCSFNYKSDYSSDSFLLDHITIANNLVYNYLFTPSHTGEMWVSVTLAVVVELVPSAVRATAVAFYFFIITNIGGNLPLLVPPLEKATSLKVALYILYPGFYLLG